MFAGRRRGSFLPCAYRNSPPRLESLPVPACIVAMKRLACNCAPFAVSCRPGPGCQSARFATGFSRWSGSPHLPVARFQRASGLPAGKRAKASFRGHQLRQPPAEAGGMQQRPPAGTGCHPQTGLWVLACSGPGIVGAALCGRPRSFWHRAGTRPAPTGCQSRGFQQSKCQ